jgi:sugar phosphate isomerase/epimerase
MVGDAGFDGVEVALGPEAVLRGPASVQSLARAHKLRVLSVHPPLFRLPGWSRFADTVKMMDFAADAGASVVVQHTPDTEDLESSAGAVWRRAMDKARQRGANRGVTLALENRAIFWSRQHEYALSDPEALYRFAEQHDFRLTLDTAHAASWPWDVVDVYDLFRDRLVNLHLSDFRSLPAWLDRPALHTYIKHHQLPGTGDLPLRELVSRAQADGYAGLVTMELSPLALRAWWPASLRMNLAAGASFVRDGSATMFVSFHRSLSRY